MSHHSHHHGHQHAGRDNAMQPLAGVLALVLFYMLVEIVGGWLTNSLALLADAGHMLSDAAALGLSLFALRIARRPPAGRQTYGYHRAEILAALANGAGLVAITIYIFVEAYERLLKPAPVLGGSMMAIAAGGLLVNLAALRILHGSRDDSLNVRSAWLHVVADAAGSVGAIVAGALIWLLGWMWIDPVVSVVIGGLILFSSWRLLRVAVGVLMEAAPGHVDVDAVRAAIATVEGVDGVHDLHIWTITTGLEALSAHVTVDDTSAPAALLTRIRETLRNRFGIAHLTIQLEPSGFEARACAEGGCI